MQTLITTYNVSAAKLMLINRFVGAAGRVHTATWQGVDVSKRREAEMVELLNVHMHIADPMPKGRVALAADIGDWLNLPWADNHFEERVCGYPINPGTEWANWSHDKSAATFLNSAGQFNHNYMERYWPRRAGQSLTASRTIDEFIKGHDMYSRLAPTAESLPHHGIRGEYGDLYGVVDLLYKDPLTRQAYLPIFFPEDTGIGDGGRKPCTLGYQWILRNDRLHTFYPMRSCDFRRHWADDIYLTLSLTEWVLGRLRGLSGFWDKVLIGSLSMHCTSLHMFINDVHQLGAKK